MREAILFVVAGAAMLAGCQRASEGLGSAGGAHGRYMGVGLYTPGPMWSQLSAGAPKSPAAARLADDEQIVVVVDSRTGEVRQCGNLSGFCIGMSPWSAALPPGQAAPATVVRHAADLATGTQAPTPASQPVR